MSVGMQELDFQSSSENCMQELRKLMVFRIMNVLYEEEDAVKKGGRAGQSCFENVTSLMLSPLLFS